MRLALVGFGNIARTLLAEIVKDRSIDLDELTILCLPEFEMGVKEALEGEFAGVAGRATAVTDLDALLAARPTIAVECAGHEAVRDHVPRLLRAGYEVVVVSIGALCDPDVEAALRDAAEAGGGRIVLPAGAIGGIDILAAIAAAGDVEIAYRGVKPPRAWAGTAAAETIDLDRLTGPTVFFEGTARQAARAFPRNANVAATLALAGGGFERMKVELVADPAAGANIHEYRVVSPLATCFVRIENQASAGNAKTSVSTVFSVLREIRNRTAPLSI